MLAAGFFASSKSLHSSEGSRRLSFRKTGEQYFGKSTFFHAPLFESSRNASPGRHLRAPASTHARCGGGGGEEEQRLGLRHLISSSQLVFFSASSSPEED